MPQKEIPHLRASCIQNSEQSLQELEWITRAEYARVHLINLYFNRELNLSFAQGPVLPHTLSRATFQSGKSRSRHAVRHLGSTEKYMLV